MPYIRWFRDIGAGDLAVVGGKNASLGELYRELRSAGVRVPDGFAITVDAYRAVVESGGLRERIAGLLRHIDGCDVAALAAAGAAIRPLVETAPWPGELEQAVRDAYATLGGGASPIAVAVRSSATAEDLPEASFAGQHETYLGVCGADEVVRACRRCLASVFTDRAIAYRIDRGFDHLAVRLSVGVQRMVRSDIGAAGVMFTLDPDSGFRNVVLVDAAYGLGEAVVGGGLDPDEFWLFKPTLACGKGAILKRSVGRKDWKLVLGADGRPQRADVDAEEAAVMSLTDADAVELARAAVAIEEHYSRRRGEPTPMDIEWAKDGADHQLYIVQARPETVHRAIRPAAVEVFTLSAPGGTPIVTGKAVGEKIGVGPARLVRKRADLEQFQQGDVLVAAMTDPDWEPVMKRAAGIVTDRGGRTCHAAIVSRELGIPCVVGTERAMTSIAHGEYVTVSCAEGETGAVYRGSLPFEKRSVDMASLPRPRTAVMLNVGNPERAFRLAGLPNDDVGLARIEFIIANAVKAHPMALLHPNRVCDRPTRAEIYAMISGYESGAEYFGSSRRGCGRHRRCLPPEGRHRASLGLQVQRIHGPARWLRLRAGGGQSDARLPRRLPLRAPALPRSVRPRVPGDAPGPRGHGFDESQADGSVLPDARGRPPRGGPDGAARSAAGRARARDLRHVRDPVQRHPRAGVRRDLRRILHRLERSHPARPRRGSRFRAGGPALRRAQPGGAVDDRQRHRDRAGARQEDRDLRSGT